MFFLPAVLFQQRPDVFVRPGRLQNLTRRLHHARVEAAAVSAEEEKLWFVVVVAGDWSIPEAARDFTTEQATGGERKRVFCLDYVIFKIYVKSGHAYM